MQDMLQNHAEAPETAILSASLISKVAQDAMRTGVAWQLFGITGAMEGDTPPSAANPGLPQP